MSIRLSPEQAINRVPGWAAADTVVEKQLAGLTNRSFRIRRGSERYVLRLDAEHTPLIGIDREAELTALRKAADAGLGPEVVFAEPGAGILVTRFLAGMPLRITDLQNDDTLAAIADLLRRVHRLSPEGPSFDAVGAARRYSEVLRDDGGLRATADLCVSIVADAERPAELAFCHNDVVAENLIADDSLRLIDWEYAGCNDPAFDLATLIAYHDLSEHSATSLISAYSGGTDAPLFGRVRELSRVCDALHWLWLAVRESVDPEAGQARRLRRLRERIAGRS